MHSSFGSFIAVALLASVATADAMAQERPDCGSDPRAVDVPELLYSFDDFDHEAYAIALNSLRTKLPERIEERDKWLRTYHPEDGNGQIFQGEVSMAYFNLLTVIEGYALKLEYLSADETQRAEKKNQFCNFLLNAIIID